MWWEKNYITWTKHDFVPTFFQAKQKKTEGNSTTWVFTLNDIWTSTKSNKIKYKPDNAKQVEISIVQAEVDKHDTCATVKPSILTQLIDKLQSRTIATYKVLFVAPTMVNCQSALLCWASQLLSCVKNPSKHT